MVSISTNGQESTILAVDGLTRSYEQRGRILTVLDSVTFEVGDRESVAIVGPSGSGKTTLLGLCAGLDRPSSGSIVLCGRDIGNMTEDEIASLRNENVGFVFQAFRLIPTLTAIENVMVPAELRGGPSARRRAGELLKQVGLDDRLDHYPSQLSGGEQQRVAVARAFINRPRILFADEPTGNLDTETGGSVEDLLFELNETAGTTLVVVTHNTELANRTDRIIRLGAGRVVEDTGRPQQTRAAKQAGRE